MLYPLDVNHVINNLSQLLFGYITYQIVSRTNYLSRKWATKLMFAIRRGEIGNAVENLC